MICPTLYSTLMSGDYNANDIQILLEQDASTVNKFDVHGNLPLQHVLADPRCSVDIVKLLLDYGADINLEEKQFHLPPLNYALTEAADVNVIALLLEYGADVNKLSWGSTPLHFVLMNKRDNYCKINKINTLKLLLQKVDVKKVDSGGRPPMCFALQLHGPDVIQLLLDAGAHVNACQFHVSPLHCLTNSHYLNLEVIKRFLDIGAYINKVDEKGNLPIHLALKYADCGVSEIRFLLHVKDVDINVRNRDGESLLHCAVKNSYCKVSILKFLIKRGACNVTNIKFLLHQKAVDDNVRNGEWDSLLHCAVKNVNCKVSILKFLIQRGARVDSITSLGCNPLHLAAENLNCQPAVIKMLLDKCCPVNVVNKLGLTPLQIAVSEFIHNFEFDYRFSDGFARIEGISNYKLIMTYKYKERLESISLILKHLLLQCPDFKMEDSWKKDWIQKYGDRYNVLISEFARECMIELQGMEWEHVGSNFTLRQFLEVSTDQESDQELDQVPAIENKSKVCYFNQLLRIVTKDKFPEYFEVILSKIGRSFMIDRLQEMLVYTEISDSDFPCRKKKVILDYTSVRVVADFLSDQDLFNLIQTFHTSDISDFREPQFFWIDENDLVMLNLQSTFLILECDKW